MSDLTSLPDLNRDAVLRLIPRGAIILWAGTTAPDGFLLCNGAAYSQVSYYKLFQVIGTTYGGSGGTFNVPNITAYSHASPAVSIYYYIKY